MCSYLPTATFIFACIGFIEKLMSCQISPVTFAINSKTTSMRLFFTLAFACGFHFIFAQTANIKGILQDAEGAPAAFASVGLYASADSNLVKAAATTETGQFQLVAIPAGQYFLRTSFVGFGELVRTNITTQAGQELDLGILKFSADGVVLAEAVVTANRRMVEVKPDRTIFNVEGTINATGSDGLQLLRKAPGVQVDNNDNVVVLGRSGVLVYVDGKRLPLSGAELSQYLQNLQAAQIDRIDIITNPGAKYEAEGNAGIIDIKLKRVAGQGANGSLNTTFSQGRYHNANVQASANYRNKSMSAFGSAGYTNSRGFNDMKFLSYQNNLVLDEIADMQFPRVGPNWRLGTDFFLSKKHTLGFLMSGNKNSMSRKSYNEITLAQESNPTQIDSILVADSFSDEDRFNQSYNVNYRFETGKSHSLNIDLDYGKYAMDQYRFQPNEYYNSAKTQLFSSLTNSFNTPTDINISTVKLDYEQKLLGGQLGLGTKVSKVVSDNTFLFFDVLNGEQIRNDQNSNTFLYDEKVYAGYANYNRELNKIWSMSAGLRAEKTDAIGNLTTFDPTLQKPPVVLNYLSWFPSAGLTYAKSPMHVLNLNYGRRINRPDYNVLNPFNNQLSQLSYEKGNPFLRPEIVNNIELGYTMFYAFNFKLAHSVTADQITRLIAPDTVDQRAGFITWDNLATQSTTSFNISAPFTATKWWEIYINANAAYLDNQADYGNGAIVDVQAFNYSIYQQSTFSLPKGFKAELSGWYSGPGVWGGVFLYDPSYSIDLGLQKKFFREALTVRLSASDIFWQSYWSGYSRFNGLYSIGEGRNDTRRVGINLNYNFGNQQVKTRKRDTGLESEAKRVGG
jgi:iron complex outermembrane recepter protein